MSQLQESLVSSNSQLQDSSLLSSEVKPTSKSSWKRYRNRRGAKAAAQARAPSSQSVIVPEWHGVELEPKAKVELAEEQSESCLAEWPWVGCPEHLVTLAPYLNNYYHKWRPHAPFQLPRAPQTSLLFTKLLSIEVVRRTLFGVIFRHHSTAWKFGASCRQANYMLGNFVHHWDMVGTGCYGYFGNCEAPRFGPKAPVDPELQGSVGPVIIVSPIRRPQGPASFCQQVENLRTMCVAMNNWSHHFKNIQLHRVAFLSTHHLTLVIPRLVNLEVLGIYQCPMLSIAEALRLLEIIQIDRPPGRENQVSLDFYPMYHQGPVLPADNVLHQGEFGVTWDNWDHDTIKAVWALCTRILPQARKQNVDFESSHTAFRQYMDRGPCWKVEQIYGALFDTSMSTEQFAALIDCHNMDHGGDVTRFTDNVLVGDRPEGYEPYVRDYHCDECKRDVLGIFFRSSDLTPHRTLPDEPARPELICLGCKLTGWLRHERDHYKVEKRAIVQLWLRTVTTHLGTEPATNAAITRLDWNESDLDKAMRDFDTLRVDTRARVLDEKYSHDMNRTNPSRNRDHEFNETQRPIEFEDILDYPCWRRSPLVSMKDMTPSRLAEFHAKRDRAYGK
ncbi:hypothetical protein MBM_03969 [Drepanopeziza brunnea f. sp. 'multigermtubi' MB_m1]|uniref:Uncharacterized protein n=1 Tax=Marssonina brunnea f. sp. multigermtubi (strain MB_m1) TaxID=1072389 RepID=K1WZW5_MARBU|nr:uncharacterized protein MBM_03969 [Drepanopeziza brunnea f. sp. 'multigermtubi' MB_m1]EKD18197.1 hypothetical protein MBM_03969 [Drepanopeziza brunnea f. sp. 'multigermtubi' MB_m1]